jgi:hypothetical protein
MTYTNVVLTIIELIALLITFFGLGDAVTKEIKNKVLGYIACFIGLALIILIEAVIR